MGCCKAGIKATQGLIKSGREFESLRKNTPGAAQDRPAKPITEAHVEDLVVGADLFREHQTVRNAPGKAFATPRVGDEACADAGVLNLSV